MRAARSVKGWSGMRTDDAVRVRNVATDRGLASCMNDTKWRELCEAFRHWPKSPRFRIRDLLADEGYISDWDGEWYYHPLPYVSIHWLEVELSEDQIPQALDLCKRIGAPIERSPMGLRVWGWIGPTDRPQLA